MIHITWDHRTWRNRWRARCGFLQFFEDGFLGGDPFTELATVIQCDRADDISMVFMELQQAQCVADLQ